jgi:2-phospho-L-lactate guanylyltransferase
LAEPCQCGGQEDREDRAAVVVPIKSFSKGKTRLSPLLSPAERARLSRELAAVVLGAAAPLCPIVVCDDEEVAAFAKAHGATVSFHPGVGLSAAVGAGVLFAAEAGAELAIVAHGDLGLARPGAFQQLTAHRKSRCSLARSLPGSTEALVTIVPDRRLAGTNVICVPTESGFGFSYGPGSLARHRAEAARLGLDCQLVYDFSLGVDVDIVEDLALIGSLR